MSAITFDTLAYANKLKAVGVEEKQAEIQAETLASVIDEQMASSRDLKELELSIKRDLKELELNLNHKIESEIGNLKHDLTIKLGGMLAVSIGVVAALVKIL
jgi:hypothetical protein